MFAQSEDNNEEEGSVNEESLNITLGVEGDITLEDLSLLLEAEFNEDFNVQVTALENLDLTFS